jgi:K+-sensing histidine kinase KdpD/CheY-like chemotaxis protein
MFRYAFAIFLVALLLLLKRTLAPHIDNEARFLLGVVPALIATWQGGPGPGLLAAALSTAALTTLFSPPGSEPATAVTVVFKTIAFAGENLAVIALVASFQSSRAQTEQAAARIQSSYELAVTCGRAKNAHDVAADVLQALITLLGASGASVYIASAGDRTLRLFAYRVPPRHAKLVSLYAEAMLDDSGGIGFVARTRTPVFLENEGQWREQFPDVYAQLRQHGLVKCNLCVPMVARDTLVGVLFAGFPNERPFSAEDRSWTLALASDCGRALDRIHLLETEQRAYADAREAGRAKDDFLAVVSEELRAPLMAIGNWTRELRRHRGDRDLRELAAQAIERSALAHARLIEGLVDQSRMVAHDLRFETTRVDLWPLLSAVVAPLRIDAAHTGVQLDLGPRVDAEVVGDADRLRQVVRDFITDALSSTPSGGAVRVEMSVKDRRAFVRIASDGHSGAMNQARRNGDGDGRMSADPFGESARLVIARYVVQWNRGDVRFDRSAGPVGAVIIDLPVPDPVAGAMGMITRPRPPATVAPLRLAGMRVFLVSDDVSEREIIEEMATDEGAEVWSTTSTGDALDRLRSLAPDVIVTDLVGPDDCVLEFIRRLRALPAPAATAPAVAYTASMAATYIQALSDAGYQRHLLRPPEPRALSLAVASLRRPVDSSQHETSK